MNEQELLNRIKELEDEKRSLKNEIEQLKNPERFFGNVKFGMRHYQDFRPDDYFIAVSVKYKNAKNSHWQAIVNAPTREETIDGLRTVVSNLTNLLSQLEEPHG